MAVGSQPSPHLAEEPIVAAVNGEMFWEEAVALPAPDRHIGDWHHLAQHAPREQPLLVVMVDRMFGRVRVCHVLKIGPSRPN